MSSYVPAALRRAVAARALGTCEYCLIHEDDTDLGCQVEHVIAEKHGGPTSEENLAYACVFCNQYKGTDIATLTPARQLVRLFNPRSDQLRDQFMVRGSTLIATTQIGEATLTLLRMNDTERLLERQSLQLLGRYPLR